MAQPMASGSVVSLEAIVLAQSFAFEALLNIAERRGRITRTEVPEEIKRLRAGTAKAQGTQQGSS
jgi:hypothetical protein